MGGSRAQGTAGGIGVGAGLPCSIPAWSSCLHGSGPLLASFQPEPVLPDEGWYSLQSKADTEGAAGTLLPPKKAKKVERARVLRGRWGSPRLPMTFASALALGLVVLSLATATYRGFKPQLQGSSRKEGKSSRSPSTGGPLPPSTGFNASASHEGGSETEPKTEPKTETESAGLEGKLVDTPDKPSDRSSKSPHERFLKAASQLEETWASSPAEVREVFAEHYLLLPETESVPADPLSPFRLLSSSFVQTLAASGRKGQQCWAQLRWATALLQAADMRLHEIAASQHFAQLAGVASPLLGVAAQLPSPRTLQLLQQQQQQTALVSFAALDALETDDKTLQQGDQQQQKDGIPEGLAEKLVDSLWQALLLPASDRRLGELLERSRQQLGHTQVEVRRLGLLGSDPLSETFPWDLFQKVQELLAQINGKFLGSLRDNEMKEDQWSVSGATSYLKFLEGWAARRLEGIRAVKEEVRRSWSEAHQSGQKQQQTDLFLLAVGLL